MRRLHLFEIEDQRVCPAVRRDGVTAYMELAAHAGRHARQLSPVLAQMVQRTGERRVSDLCSGSGGLLAGIVDGLAADGLAIDGRRLARWRALVRPAAEPDASV